MDYDDYKQYLRGIRQKYGSNVGLDWAKAHCQPKIDLTEVLFGWKLLWVGLFPERHYLCVKENWTIRAGDSQRDYFSYHYGRYQEGWDLEKVKPKSVIVRIDGVDYHRLGYHIHDQARDKRIYQVDFVSPDLSQVQIGAFIESILALRGGKTVEEAFELTFR